MSRVAKQPSVINKSELRRRMVKYAMAKRYHFQITEGVKIKSSTIEEAEALVEAWFRHKIDHAPSKGVMI